MGFPHPQPSPVPASLTLDFPDSPQLAQTKAAEIEDLLQRLSDTNDEMSSLITGASDSRSHTLARHRDILQEFSQVLLSTARRVCMDQVAERGWCMQEFRRLDSTLGAARDRAHLLSNASEGTPLLGVQVCCTGGAVIRSGNTWQGVILSHDTTINPQVQGSTGALLRERATVQSATNAVRPGVSALHAAHYSCPVILCD